jgi:hypothetical protein
LEVSVTDRAIAAEAQQVDAQNKLSSGLHDLSNALGLVIGHAELMADDPELPAHARESASLVYASAIQAADILERLRRLTHALKLEDAIHGAPPTAPPEGSGPELRRNATDLAGSGQPT